jgi:hypothetical protein
LPESNDIVLAGPAGPWRTDEQGRAVSVGSRKPTLQLDDMVICLRNAFDIQNGNAGKFGCTINPRQENWKSAKQFVETSRLRGQAWREALRKTVGLQDISIYGIEPRSHAARVLVEADYHMKMVAMGLERSIPEVSSYLQRIELGPQGAIPEMDVVRWWFTLNYDDVIADKDLSAFTFTGTGVRVLSENEFIDNQGGRVHSGQSNAPTAGFARDFTKHFESMADRYPVYRELKNVFDLAIAAAIIKNHQLDRKADWQMTYFGDASSYTSFQYAPRKSDIPRQVDSIMNYRVLTERRKSQTLKHTIVGVSGGVSFDAASVVRNNAIRISDDGKLSEMANESTPVQDQENWWWD